MEFDRLVLIMLEHFGECTRTQQLLFQHLQEVREQVQKKRDEITLLKMQVERKDAQIYDARKEATNLWEHVTELTKENVKVKRTFRKAVGCSVEEYKEREKTETKKTKKKASGAETGGIGTRTRRSCRKVPY